LSDRSRAIAELLLDIGAVTVSPRQPFTWASGLKAPLYCDNRLLISDVAARQAVVEGFLAMIRDAGWQPDLIAGTATAGIPHAAWLAHALSLPMVYIRGAQKKHGKQNRIEGRVAAGSSAVVIEDLISTGGSVISAAKALTERGVHILGIGAVFQYGMARSRASFADAGYPYATLTDLDTLLRVALERELLSKDEIVSVQTWREDPKAWSDSRAE